MEQTAECPHCSEDLTESQLYDMLAVILDKRRQACNHEELEIVWGTDNMLCEDCGAVLEVESNQLF